jgi:cytochrome c553
VLPLPSAKAAALRTLHAVRPRLSRLNSAPLEVRPLEVRPSDWLSTVHRREKAHHMHRIPMLLVALLVTAVAAGPDGRVIAQNGNGHGAAACTSCHGQHFEGTPAIHAPALAGLSAATVLARLAHYAGPTGRNAMMRQVATALSPAERQAVATYLAGLPQPR